MGEWRDENIVKIGNLETDSATNDWKLLFKKICN